MEDSLASRDGEVPADDDKVSHEHDGEGSPQPIGAANGDVLSDPILGRVGVQSVVGHVDMMVAGGVG